MNIVAIPISNAPFVEGYRRGCFYDLIRRTFHFAPNDMALFLDWCKGRTRESIVVDHPDPASAMTYLELLTGLSLLEWVPEPLVSSFPPLETEWRHPSLITNCVIDVASDQYRSGPILELLGRVRCAHVQIRFISFGISLDEVRSVLAPFDGSHVDDIQIITSYSCGISVGEWQEVIASDPRVNSVRLTNAPLADRTYHGDSLRPVILIPGGMEHYPASRDGMVITMGLYCESQSFHTYFNRKMYIAADGSIANAPETLETHANAYQPNCASASTSLMEDQRFNKYWRTNKNITDVCKDCEFRHMCVDNRVPVVREDATWYHSVECDYNPYICKWKGEEGYCTLAESGVVSNAEGFRMDHDLITSINAELWGE